MTATWLPQTMGYRVDGRAVSELRQKGATEAIVSQSNAQIRVIADRLQRGEIDVSEFYAAMQRETKTLQMASAALARGGVENMRPADWNRVENVIAEQWSGGEKFAGLRAFAEDIARGRYGQNAGELGDAVLSRAGLYAQAGRATYENERVELARENGNTLARRVLGAADSCVDCVSWASDEWRPIEEVEPIASSVCGARCHCVIVTRREGQENVDIPANSSSSASSGGTTGAGKSNAVLDAESRLTSDGIANVDLGEIPDQAATRYADAILDFKNRFPSLQWDGVLTEDIGALTEGIEPLVTRVIVSNKATDEEAELVLRVNRQFFDGKTIPEIEAELKTASNLGDVAYQTLEDLIEHECSHSLVFYGEKAGDVAALNLEVRALEFQFDGMSSYGESNGLEGIAECFVLARRDSALLDRVTVRINGQLADVRATVKLYTGVDL